MTTPRSFRAHVALTAQVAAPPMWSGVYESVGEFFAAALAPADAVGAVQLVSIVLCWLVAAVTLISGAKYLWDNRQFINTAK